MYALASFQLFSKIDMMTIYHLIPAPLKLAQNGINHIVSLIQVQSNMDDLLEASENEEVYKHHLDILFSKFFGI